MAGGLNWRYSLRALGGRLGEQWERERRDTLFLMGSIILTAATHFPHLPWWATAAFLLFFFWRLGLVLSGRSLPPAWVRWVAALACSAGVYAHHDTLLGRDPGVMLLALFLGLKLMEMRARRDLFVVLFLCFFLLLTTFFYSQTPLTAGFCVVAVLLLVATMVTMQFGIKESPIPSRLKTAGWLLLQAVPIAAALFILFPRIQTPLWGLPEDSQGAKTGLSESMEPGNIAKLSKSDEVAFRVLFQGKRPAEAQMYWRGPVLGDFDGRRWRQLAQSRSTIVPLEISAKEDEPKIRYALTQEPNNRPWLMALEAPIKIEGLQQNLVIFSTDMQVVSREMNAGRIRYEVESILNYQLGMNETEQSLRDWVSLPSGFNPKTIELAQQWRKQTSDPGELVAKAMAMFSRAPFRYTLEAPLLGKNSVDDFLFETQAGFCEHYANALVVMMRALEIPARVVTGYQGGELNPVDNYWVVRQADAHAWTEIWMSGRGWVRVDPVTAIAPQRIERGARGLREYTDSAEQSESKSMFKSIRLNLDALSNAWNQWLLSYDSNKQQNLLSKFGFSFTDWREMAALLAGVLTVLIGIAALMTLRPRVAQDPIDRWFREFCDRLAAVGLVRAPHETADRYLERITPGLNGPQLRAARLIVGQYNLLRYGSDGIDLEAIRALRKQVGDFKP